MKNKSGAAILGTLALSLYLCACNKETVSTPEPNEQELITALSVGLAKGGGAPVWYTYSVTNGFHADQGAEFSVDTIRLEANSSYAATIRVYNESVNPGIDVTPEIIAEQNTHLFFHQPDSSSGLRTGGLDTDKNGQPFGLRSTWTTQGAANATMRIILFHGPRRKSETTPAAIAGSTDADAIFPVQIR